MLHTISMEQALEVWSDLEAAYYGKNKFGGDTAEIYVYRFLTGQGRDLKLIDQAGLFADMTRETYDKANAAMLALFTHFVETHSNTKLLVDDQELGPWLAKSRNTHRVHVRVVHT